MLFKKCVIKKTNPNKKHKKISKTLFNWSVKRNKKTKRHHIYNAKTNHRSKEAHCPHQEGHNQSRQNQEQRWQHKIQGQMCQILVHIHLWRQEQGWGNQEDDPKHSSGCRN